jgi:[glutamine synthetase] adenylyltransferase / [glutamine synthetase]-adenylyl-L-tyrosine phosphorylase
MSSPSTETTNLPETEREAKLRSLAAEVASAGIPLTIFMPLFRKKLLGTPDPDRALNNFLRFIASGFTSSLLRNFADHPVLVTIALTLFGHSQYLADILVRSPELFHWLTATNALNDARSREDYYREALSVIAPFERIDKKFDALKRFQRREILKISTRDILKEADLATITGELSWLADALVGAAVQIGTEDLNRRLGGEIVSTFCVVGLGKLGGAELNFSSDIDLMFVYDTDGDLEYGAERIHSNYEYYCRIAEFVVRKLSEHTDEGHLYRIDMRLRPDGASGPLAMSRQGYLRYYESRGELWERQMLLKARIIAGNQDVGQQFLDDLRPFVYPSTILRDPREEILAMKKRIESGLGEGTNVKLSRGGIRDVEFIVQALQLLQSNAGERWREPNTLKAIEKLGKTSSLTRREAVQLRQGYQFLRHVEHRLQLLHGAQTHELPNNKEELGLLGRRLGFKSTAAFEKALVQTQGQIRGIYDSVFLNEPVENTNRRTHKQLSIYDLRHLVSKHGFLEPRRAVEAVEQLRKDHAQFDELDSVRKLLSHLHKLGAPDFGLMNFRILCSSQSLLRTIDQVLANDRMLNLLVTVCSRSHRLTVQLAQEPLLFESLLGRTEDFFKPGLEWQFLLRSDPVRFRAFNECKVLIGFLTGEISIEQAGRGFTQIADTVAQSLLDDLLARSPELRKELCVVALGKYGGEEMLIGSDLDLLIFFQSTETADSGHALDKWASEFVRSFSTESGHVYDIDLRLRPEGKNAPLATEFSYYEKYLAGRAELWEKQALLKSRIIFDGGGLGRKFETLRNSVLANVGTQTEWPRQMLAMRSKMERERGSETARQKDLKIVRGGLVDLEFLIQAAQLKYYSADKAMRAANSFDAIEYLSTMTLLGKKQAKVLIRNYEFLRTLELSIRLNSESNQFVLPEDKVLLQALAASVDERSGKDLRERITKSRKENRSLMNGVFMAIRR